MKQSKYKIYSCIPTGYKQIKNQSHLFMKTWTKYNLYSLCTLHTMQFYNRLSTHSRYPQSSAHSRTLEYPTYSWVPVGEKTRQMKKITFIWKLSFPSPPKNKKNYYLALCLYIYIFLQRCFFISCFIKLIFFLTKKLMQTSQTSSIVW